MRQDSRKAPLERVSEGTDSGRPGTLWLWHRNAPLALALQRTVWLWHWNAPFGSGTATHRLALALECTARHGVPQDSPEFLGSLGFPRILQASLGYPLQKWDGGERGKP